MGHSSDTEAGYHSVLFSDVSLCQCGMTHCIENQKVWNSRHPLLASVYSQNVLTALYAPVENSKIAREKSQMFTSIFPLFGQGIFVYLVLWFG